MCDMCRGASLEQVLARYQRMVDEYGWAVIQVECDGLRVPGFAYTVGLYAFGGHPELLISGCPCGGDIAGVLNNVADHVADGLSLDASGAVPGCVHEDVRVVEVADPRRLMVAQALLGNDDVLVPALQLVRPDPRGRWPWEAGWSEPGTEFFGRSVGCIPQRRAGGPRPARRGQRAQPSRRARLR